MSTAGQIRHCAISQRHLQIALGALWLLDGALQLQPFMFSKSFLTTVIGAAAAGQPHFLGVTILDVAHLMARHLAFYNSSAASIQIIIGVGLLFPRTVRPALIVSFGWACGVWVFGEGAGMLLTGEANPLTGAPGAVLLYLLAGLLLWPVDRPHPRSVASQGLLNNRGGRLAWTCLWLGFAVLTLLSASLASSGISTAFTAGGTIAPGPLANLDAALSRVSAGHGIPIALMLAAAELGIGAGMLRSSLRNAAAVLGGFFGLAIWLTAEGLGGLSTGQATDPNSGPLLMLLAAALYVPVAAQPGPAPNPPGTGELQGAPKAHESHRVSSGEKGTPMHKRRSVALTAAVAAVILGTSGGIIATTLPAQGAASKAPVATAVEFNGGQLAFHDAMRELWEQHVLWTRLFIVSDVFGNADLSATTTRLLANQTDIGNAVKPFYGEADGDHLTALLMRHILLAANILADAKAGNASGLAQAEREWYANANQIAAFLHRLNPMHWPLAGLRAMMREHLNLTLTEAVDELTGKYGQSVAEFNAVENEILGMADTLSNGIIAQFPSHFR